MQTRRSRVVIVSGDEENRAALKRIFEEDGWEIRETSALSEFRRHLKPRWTGVILTECCLPDGTWRDVLTVANSVSPASQVLVTARAADEHLWAEVLSRGAFDLLAQPLDPSEVLRAGASAWLHSGPKARRAGA